MNKKNIRKENIIFTLFLLVTIIIIYFVTFYLSGLNKCNSIINTIENKSSTKCYNIEKIRDKFICKISISGGDGNWFGYRTIKQEDMAFYKECKNN